MSLTAADMAAIRDRGAADAADLNARLRNLTGQTLTQRLQGSAAHYVRARRLGELVDQARRWGWTDCAAPIPAPADLLDTTTTRPCGQCPQCEWHRSASELLDQKATNQGDKEP